MKGNLIFVLLTAIFLAACNPGVKPVHKTPTAIAPPVNLAAEVARANAENKIVFLEFGSSDSCPPCVELEEEVFSKPEFQAYVKTNFIFLHLDFPVHTDLPPAVTATNIILHDQFGIDAFPTFIALDENGKEFWRLPEKGEMTLDLAIFKPKGFIALMESVKKKKK